MDTSTTKSRPSTTNQFFSVCESKQQHQREAATGTKSRTKTGQRRKRKMEVPTKKPKGRIGSFPPLQWMRNNSDRNNDKSKRNENYFEKHDNGEYVYVYNGGRVGQEERNKIISARVASHVVDVEKRGDFQRSLLKQMHLYTTGSATTSSTRQKQVDKRGYSRKWPWCLFRRHGHSDDTSTEKKIQRKRNTFSPNTNINTKAKTNSPEDDEDEEIISNEKIKGHAFYCCQRLRTVHIPNSVSKIGPYAFSRCFALMDIDLTHCVHLRHIQEWTFFKCKGLQSIGLPTSTITIGQGAFSSCVSLQCVDLSQNTDLAEIGPQAFQGCDELTTVKFPTTMACLKQFDNFAFSNCPSLTRVDVPDSVQVIGKYAFACCRALRIVNITNSIKIIDDWTFADCNELHSIHFPDSCEEIRNNAFFKCSSLETLELPDSIQSIGVYAFYECTNLSSVVLPSCLKGLHEGAFQNCSSLERITLPKTLERLEDNLFRSCSALVEVNFSSSTIQNPVLREVREGVFQNCSSLTTMTLPKSVEILGKESFRFCSALKQVAFFSAIDDAMLQDIGPEAFSGCVALEAVDLPKSMKRIGNGAFEHCKSLRVVKFPQSLEELGGGAFYNCHALSKVGFHPNSKLKLIDQRTFCHCLELSSVTSLPTSLEGISSKAFLGCRSLREIELPNNVKSIGVYAFANCSALSYLIIPDSLLHVRRYAFSNCPGITRIQFPPSFGSKEIQTSGRGLCLTSEAMLAIQFFCNTNRAGRNRFLQRTSSSSSSSKERGEDSVKYPVALWPHVLHRALTKVQYLKTLDLDCSVVPSCNPDRKDGHRYDVVYYLLLNSGVWV